MKKIKIAVLGCGWIGMGASSDILRDSPATHVEGIMSNSSFDLVALHDISNSAHSNADSFAPGIPFYHSHYDLFKNVNLDAVVIASNPETHFELIKSSIEQGIKNILCEKPLCLDLNEAESIVHMVKSKKVNLVVNHMRRFSPIIIRLRDYLQNKYIRDTITGNVQGGYAFYDKGLYHCGTHIIDLLIFLLGSVKSVSAVNSVVYEKSMKDISPEVILSFSHCQISLKPFFSPQYAISELCLYGEKGAVRLKDMWGRKIEFVGIKSDMNYSAYKKLNDDEPKIFVEKESFMSSTFRYFASTIQSNTFNDALLSDNLHIIKVMDSIRISADNFGKEIKINN